jgi:hypothetical protein
MQNEEEDVKRRSCPQTFARIRIAQLDGKGFDIVHWIVVAE